MTQIPEHLLARAQRAREQSIGTSDLPPELNLEAIRYNLSTAYEALDEVRRIPTGQLHELRSRVEQALRHTAAAQAEVGR